MRSHPRPPTWWRHYGKPLPAHKHYQGWKRRLWRVVHWPFSYYYLKLSQGYADRAVEHGTIPSDIPSPHDPNIVGVYHFWYLWRYYQNSCVHLCDCNWCATIHKNAFGSLPTVIPGVDLERRHGATEASMEVPHG